MRAFSDPRKIREASFQEFSAIVGQVLKLKGISGKISYSKGGSNVKFRIELPGAKPVTLSYHPIHYSGSSSDKAFDPNRRRSLQGCMTELERGLTGTSDEKKVGIE